MIQAGALPAVTQPAVTRLDRFGNQIDPSVMYARGAILRSDADEIDRQRHAYALIRHRRATLGEASVHNLTGLIRGFHYQDGDAQDLRSYIHFGMRDGDDLQEAALRLMGGTPGRHDGFLCCRVSSAILATMLALLPRGATVASVVPADRSHPSIRQSVGVAGGVFVEVVGIPALEAWLRESGVRPAMVVVTAISPSKHHMDEADILRGIALARAADAIAFVDDAHMAARLSVYDERASLALGADLAVWSLDKHVTGPRSGFLAGRPDLVRLVRARAFAFGLEAQPGQILAGLNAVRAFEPSRIREAAGFARELFAALQPGLEGRAYMAGPGVAISGEDLMELALRRSGRNAPGVAPIEAVAAAAMELLELTGGVTIPAVGMPGAACVYRLMAYPDGQRLGLAPIVQGTLEAIDWLAAHIADPAAVRRRLLGEAAAPADGPGTRTSAREPA